MATFTIETWGDVEPDADLLAQELERIGPMVRDGFTSGEAFMDEDFAGQGWWSATDFSENED